MPGTTLEAFQKLLEAEIITTLVQMRKPSLGEVEKLAHRYPARKCQSYLSPGSPAPENKVKRRIVPNHRKRDLVCVTAM